jgi:prepilin-type processing-associated H-X9-DG protein
MKRSPRYAVFGLAAVGLLAVFALGPTADPKPLAAAPAAVAPLDRVPADAGLVVHFRAGDLWNHSAVNEIKKTYAKDLEKALKTVQDETGLKPEQIETVTFHWPKLPMGPGDEALFVLQVTTKTPYVKDTLLSGFRAKDEKATGDVIKLREKMLLHLTSETQFTVLHETLLDQFKKGKAATTDGVLSDALKAARAGKHALVAGFDPSGLPAEIFTAAPPELQPFLPLLKSRSIVLKANLEKELTASVQFGQENEEKAVDAERSFNLLMKLADDALMTALAEADKKNEELKALAPALTELQKVVKNVQAKRQGTVVTADASLKADPALVRPIAGIFLRPQMASARARSQNNLKQIGLALHNYHDVYGVFPAAAICDKKGKPLLSWRVAILPFVEQDNLYKQFHLDEAWDSPHNKKLADTVVKVYELPYGEPKRAHTNYRVFVGNGAVFDMVQGCKISQITDGTSNTVLVFEGAESTPWAKPDEIEFDPKKPMVKHLRFEDNSVCNILMADGSVRAVPSKLPEEILRLLIQKDDGMPIPDVD